MRLEHDVLPYFYPTSVVLVDDDRRLLESLEARIGQYFNCYSFSRPKEALAFFEGWHSRDAESDVLARFFERAVSSGQEARRLIEMLGAHLTQLRVNPDRFAAPSVAVVDLSMPEMDGLMLCNAMRGFGIRKILLTGAATPNAVIEAFNTGLIDCFVSKNFEDITTEICAHLYDFQFEFIKHRAAGLKYVMSLHALSFMQDKNFQLYFSQLKKTRDIAEYYVRYEPIGIEVIDRNGDGCLLLVLTEDEIDDRIATAKTQNAPLELIEAMDSRSRVGYFPSHFGYYEARFQNSWQMHLFACDAIPGSKNWWVSLIPFSSLRPAGLKQFVSYDQFRSGRASRR